MPCLTIDETGIGCAHVQQNFGPIALSAGWRGLAIEHGNNNLRFFVDDFCLGESAVSPGSNFEGIRIRTAVSDRRHAPGKNENVLWIAGFSAGRQLPVMPFPKTDPTQDWLWLIHGEQLFGRIVSADRSAVVLDAKFGRQRLEWSRLRGIGFAGAPAQLSVDEVEIHFRPTAGFSADCLRAKLLRWEDDKLVIRHAVLGVIAVERGCLEYIRITKD